MRVTAKHSPVLINLPSARGTKPIGPESCDCGGTAHTAMSIVPYLKEIGRGAKGSRSLSRVAAQDLMARILDGECSELETGAFLMAMRMKGESLDELGGFLAAAQARCTTVPAVRPVVLLPSYNGSRRLPNLTPLLALWLAREGVDVLVHGALHEPGRVTTAEVLHDLGLAPVMQVQDISQAWSRREPAFLATAWLCPALQALLDCRQRLGVRGPGHTVAKMLDPVHGAPTLRLVNHTHPEFGQLMSGWAQRDAVSVHLLRGTEGEPVADPRRQPRIDTWIGGSLQPHLCLAAQEGVLTELPVLPLATDAASTAVYVQDVLSGERPAPPTLLRQAALIVATVAALQRQPFAPAAAVR